MDKLNTKGLIKRETCGHDRRQVDIAITEKGVKLLKAMETTSNEIDLKIKSNLTTDEAKQLNDFLDRIRD